MIQKLNQKWWKGKNVRTDNNLLWACIIMTNDKYKLLLSSQGQTNASQDSQDIK